ncbi:MAG: FAD-dependent oxidoreductase, partial [Actinobacteria bacterium]
KRVAGVLAHDMETGRIIEVRGRVVVNAAGVWSDDIESLAGERSPQVTASKGIHVVVPRDRIRADAGLITKTEKSVLFVIPFHDHWLIGTTDTPWTLGKAHPAASRADIEYLLGHLNSLLREPLGPGDITGVFAGLRPLVTGEAESTAKLSREHSITRPAPGLVSIAGGKYTTYRVMAEDVVNEATSHFAEPPPPTRTRDIPLHGAIGWQQSGSGPHAGHLRRRHGSDTAHIEALIAEEPVLGEPVVPDAPYLRAEVVWAATHEAALHLDDVLTRRTRISIEVPDRGIAAAPVVADLMAPVLGWDPATVARELEHYRARVAAERDSQEMPDDRTADAARMGAPDVRTAGNRRPSAGGE